MKSLNQLLPVIKDIADNETDENVLNYYEEIIYSTNRSIVALNNLVSMQYTHIHCLYCINYSLQIAALGKNSTADNVTKEEEKGEGFNTDTQGSSNTTETTPTDGKPTDSPVKDKMVRYKLLTYAHIATYVNNLLSTYNIICIHAGKRYFRNRSLYATG